MQQRRLYVLFACLAGLASAATSAQTTAPLVQQGNMTYLGAFKLPTQSGYGFTYGGTAIAFNPANNSLFVVGHQYDQLTAEVSIPNIGGTGTLLQPLRDSLGGKLGQIGSGQLRIGGNLVYNNKLITSAFVFYDADAAQSVTHFSRPLTLNSGTVTGPYRIGSVGAGFYSGYMGHIPAEWQARFGGPALAGNCCLSIISRTSYGPAVSVFNPDTTGVSAQSLLYYPTSNQTLGRYGASGSNPVFNGSTRVTGVVFPPGTRSVLFIGMTGIGNYCYGDGAPCGDPENNVKGDHAYPYKAYVWAYDANQLLEVKAGTRQPWSVTPYATWQLPDVDNSVAMDFGVGGATYDPATSRIYVSERFGDGEQPAIHVYQVTNAADMVTPRPPTSFSAQ